MTFLAYVVPFLVVLSVLVFVHELGHYLAARWNGVRVEVFSIGFGPELFGWTDKNKTRWKVSLLPLGGYVKMLGDASAASNPDPEVMAKLSEEERSNALHAKTVYQRMAVSVAGPLANYVFAFAMFAALFATVGQRYTPAEIGFVQEGSAAQKGGLASGDRVVSVEGIPVQRFEDMQSIVSENADVSLSFVVVRGEDELQFTLTPDLKEQTDVFGRTRKMGVLGIGREGVEYIKRGPLGAVYYAAAECWKLTSQSLEAIGQMMIGARGSEGVGGPLRIAQLTGDVAQLGIPSLLWLMAILSISLGLINLFPVPVLDGGHLLFYAIEAIRGRPISEKNQERAFLVGFAIVGSLMAFAFWNDLTHLHVIEKIRTFLGL